MPTAEIATLREHMVRLRAGTLQTLQRTPADKLNWAPAPPLRSVAETFVHIARVEQVYLRGLRALGWDASARTATTGAREQRSSLRELRFLLSDSHAAMVAWLDTLAARALNQLVRVPWHPVNWPLRSWLWYLLEHEVHHRGQIALYLRVCGVEAPSFGLVLPAPARAPKRSIPPQPPRAEFES